MDQTWKPPSRGPASMVLENPMQAAKVVVGGRRNLKSYPVVTTLNHNNNQHDKMSIKMQ